MGSTWYTKRQSWGQWPKISLEDNDGQDSTINNNGSSQNCLPSKLSHWATGTGLRVRLGVGLGVWTMWCWRNLRVASTWKMDSTWHVSSMFILRIILGCRNNKCGMSGPNRNYTKLYFLSIPVDILHIFIHCIVKEHVHIFYTLPMLQYPIFISFYVVLFCALSPDFYVCWTACSKWLVEAPGWYKQFLQNEVPKTQTVGFLSAQGCPNVSVLHHCNQWLMYRS